MKLVEKSFKILLTRLDGLTCLALQKEHRRRLKVMNDIKLQVAGRNMGNDLFIGVPVVVGHNTSSKEALSRNWPFTFHVYWVADKKRPG